MFLLFLYYLIKNCLVKTVFSSHCLKLSLPMFIKCFLIFAQFKCHVSYGHLSYKKRASNHRLYMPRTSKMHPFFEASLMVLQRLGTGLSYGCLESHISVLLNPTGIAVVIQIKKTRSFYLPYGCWEKFGCENSKVGEGSGYAEFPNESQNSCVSCQISPIIYKVYN